MATQIWTLQICIVIFRLKINFKFSVKFINEQYKVFRFNIISKVYIFHLTVVMINSDRLVHNSCQEISNCNNVHLFTTNGHTF